jgi:TonB family protein
MTARSWGALIAAGAFAMMATAEPAYAQQPVPPPRHALEPPKLHGEATAPYPEGATGDTIVTLRLTVEADGSVSEAIVDEGGEPFAAAALTAANRWRFDPATRDGVPVRARIRVEIAFHPPEIVEDAPVTPPKPGAEPPPPSPKKQPIEDVVVRGERVEPGRTATLSRTEVRQIPGAFGDPFRAIEIMPGVTPIVSGLPFFFIRGAPPGNVGYYLDGVRVPLLFHVGVGPSVVHPALISRVDLYPGGYPARFGRFSGGIVSGETAEPITDKPHGEYNVRLFDAGALVETPFPNQKGSILLGGRYSYTAFLLTQLSPNTTLDYWDYQGRVTYDLSKDDRVSVFAFGSYDFLGERTQTETVTLFGTEFHRVDLRYDRRIGIGAQEGTMRVAATLGQDRTRIQEGRFVRDRLAGARTELVQKLSSDATLRFGTDLQMDTYDVTFGDNDLNPSQQRVAALLPARTDLAFGVRADTIIALSKRFEVTPGARVDLFASQGATAVGFDPRIALRTVVTDRLRFLSAMGIAHQPPSFAIPVPGFQPGGIRGGLQKSVQQSAGVELDIADGMTGTLTAFHNGFFDMSDPLGVVDRAALQGCAPGTFPSDTIAGDRASQPTAGQSGQSGFNGVCGVPRFVPGTIGPDRSGGGGQGADSTTGQRNVNALEVRTKGHAYGLELFVKKKLTAKLGGFVSYTLSRSERDYESRSFVAAFDRTHVLNVAAAYDLGRNWRAGGRVVFYTGLPKAPDPTDGSTRLPAFFRVDFRIEKRWQLGGKAWISAIAEWMNATLSTEAVATTCTLQGCTAQTVGPITIPSLGIEGGF